MPKSLNAELKLGSLFTDNMVLQREMPVPVWGTATPGSKIVVKFAGQKKDVVTNTDGQWMLHLDALKASSKPNKLSVFR